MWFTKPADAPRLLVGVGGGGTRFLDLSPGAALWLEGHGKTLVVRPNVYLNDAPPGKDYLASARYDTDVLLAAFAPPDGARFAVHTAGGRVHLPDLAAPAPDGARPSNTISLDGQKVTALQFSPTGEQLAVVGDGGFARVYDAATGKERAVLKGHGGIVFCVAFNPDGKTVVTGGDDGLARVYDAATGRLRAELTGHTDSVRAVLFDPSGRVLFTASADRTVRAWTPPG